MLNRSRILPWILYSTIVSVLLLATVAAAQTTPARPAAPVRSAQAALAPPQVAPTEKDIAATKSELIKLLRLSPTLTTVVAHDPSLLANQDYVARNNPQLAAFLVAHPEVARNPEFYLFSHIEGEDGSNESIERAVWPDVYRTRPDPSGFDEFTRDLSPLLAFACGILALVWLIRVFVENRRWGRIFKLQSEVHGRLIDKFSSTQELASYMETEAGKRFLEAAPIPVGFEPERRVPNALARVLTPLQIGIVLVLLGVGFLLLRNVDAHMRIPMLVLGTVALMPGVGFILSAGITWVLAARLGLMPENPAAPNPPFNSQDRR